MEINTIPIDFWIMLATVIATLIIGELTKKYTTLKSKQLPLQDLLIGLIVCFIEFLITKDLNLALTLSGLISGGTYDAGKAIKQLFCKEDK